MPCGKSLTLFTPALVSMFLQNKSFEITVGKGEIAHFEKLFAILIKFRNCCLQTVSVWKSLQYAI